MQPNTAISGGLSTFLRTLCRAALGTLRQRSVHSVTFERFSTLPQTRVIANSREALLKEQGHLVPLQEATPVGDPRGSAVEPKYNPNHPEVRCVSVPQAAELCGVSVDTIRRRVRDGKLVGAWRDGPTEAAPWFIPVTSLVAVGLCNQAAADNVDERLHPISQHLATKLADAEADLRLERQRKQSIERERDLLADELARVWQMAQQLVTANSRIKERSI